MKFDHILQRHEKNWSKFFNSKDIAHYIHKQKMKFDHILQRHEKNWSKFFNSKDIAHYIHKQICLILPISKFNS